MRNLIARRKEYKSVLLEVFLKDAKTEKEVIIGLRNVELIENSLQVLKMRSLMTRGSRVSGKKATSDILENLLDIEIKERHELGLMPITKVLFSELDQIWHTYRFTHTIKTRDGGMRKGYKTQVDALSEASAIENLKLALKKKGYFLVSVDKIARSAVRIVTKDRRHFSIHMIEIIDDRKAIRNH